MRITALVKSPQNVCCRYRLAAFRPALEKAGHQLQVRAMPKFWVSRLLFYHHLRQSDAVIIQRKLLPAWQLRLLRRRVRWLIYDFDDAIFLRNSYSPRGPHSPRRLRRFEDMMHLADAVIAGNDFLARQAEAFTAPERIHLIPTCVDVTRYDLAAHDPNRTPVQLVWIGSTSTLEGLGQFRQALEDFGKTIPKIQLKLICDRSLSLTHLPVRFTAWREESEAAEIAQADIGIGWLPKDLWSEGKCGLKILQYMAAGLPVVANPVGLHRTLIRDGETGFLAETPAEWTAALAKLASDPLLRRRMGRAGRRRVEAEYQLPVGTASWLRVLAKLPRRVTPQAS